MKKIYIISGVCFGNCEPYMLLGKNGIQTTLEKAREELTLCYKEIIKEWQENDLEIVEENMDNNSFYIENENGESYKYKIEERKFKE